MQGSNALRLTFVCPVEWMLDETLSPVGVRVKIENGVIFFKPAGAGVKTDVIELYRLNNAWQVHMPINHPMIERIIGQLERLGWCTEQPFFELHPAQRGWYGISLRPSDQKPADRPHVQVEMVQKRHIEFNNPAPKSPLRRDPVTVEEVARVLCISL
jgi:hypothetical protein